jgi:uncharacterized protein (TIGR04141 family)
MAKTRSFSIFLLKEDFDASNALKEDNDLRSDFVGDSLPEGAILFVLDNNPRPPWWRSYFGLQQDISQASKGALVFVPAKGRWFALSFGHVSHNLKDTSYEYDFGLRVTLNCVDPDKLKSTDILEPSGAKRQRTQLPVDSDLTFFDFDRDSTILKSLTGRVRDAHKELFKHATGASNIRISSDAPSEGLSDLCGSLLDLYRDDAYKAAFPDIQNIAPVRDPVVIERLNDKLVEAFRSKDDGLSLSIPEIQNHGDELWGTFSGVGSGKVYDDIFLDRYYEYLAEAKVELGAIGVPELKRHNLILTGEDGHGVRDRFTIFKCLIFDTTLDVGKRTFHLCEGNWYLIDTDYVAKLTDYLDPLCKETSLPNYAHANEGDYNEETSKTSASLVCLDKSNIAPKGQKQVEPCDIYEIVDGKAVLHHIKISTLSAQLSHLFNQGTNSVKLIRAENDAMVNLTELISAKVDADKADAFVAPLKAGQIRVAFGIVTHKPKDEKSKNLPLFSRISLMRCMKELKVMGIEAEFGFIKDDTPKSDGKKKKRKPKNATEE